MVYHVIIRIYLVCIARKHSSRALNYQTFTFKLVFLMAESELRIV